MCHMLFETFDSLQNILQHCVISAFEKIAMRKVNFSLSKSLNKRKHYHLYNNIYKHTLTYVGKVKNN